MSLRDKGRLVSMVPASWYRSNQVISSLINRLYGASSVAFRMFGLIVVSLSVGQVSRRQQGIPTLVPFDFS